MDIKNLYLEKIGTIDDLEIWLVNDFLVKLRHDIDFEEGMNSEAAKVRSNADDKYCPGGQMWISNNVPTDERLFIITHEIVEYRLMKEKMSYEDAHKIANDEELVLRHAVYAKLSGEQPPG